MRIEPTLSVRSIIGAYFWHYSSAATAFISLLVAVSVFYGVSDDQDRRAHARIAELGQQVATSLERQLIRMEDILLSTSALFNASEVVSRHQFYDFVLEAVPNRIGIQALEWVPRVRGDERQRYQQNAQKDGFPNFDIHEIGENGSLIAALNRNEYYPVYYVVPSVGNEKAMGFDLASNPVRRAMLEDARDNNSIIASKRVTLVQDVDHQIGVLAVAPVYETGKPVATVGQRRTALAGYVLGVFRVADVLELSIADIAGSEPLMVGLYDASDDEKNASLHMTGTGGITPSMSLPDLPSSKKFESSHQFGTRDWRLIVAPIDGKLAVTQHWVPWVSAVATFMIIWFIGVFFFVITRRKLKTENLLIKRERELDDGAARVRAIVDTAVDGIVTIDHVGTVETFNPSAERIFGYSAEEVVGHNIKMLMPDPYHSEHDGYLSAYLSTGDAKIIGTGREVTGLRKNDTTFPMELSVSEMEVDGNRMFTGIVRDITERAEAKVTVARYMRELEDRAARVRAIVDTAVDGIVTIDHIGTVETFNPSAERIFGYFAEEVIGHNIKMLMPDPYRSEHDGYLDAYLTTGDAKIIGTGREVIGLRKNGTTFPMDLSVSEMEVDGNRMFTGIVRDITERTQAENRISRHVSSLQRSNEELEKFAYVASHDLQEPLRKVQAFGDRLKSKYADVLDDKGIDYLDRMQNAGARMSILINDLLSFSRIATHGKSFVPTRLDHIVLGVLNDLEILISETGATVKVGTLPTIDADPLQIRQLFQNVISNAIKYRRMEEASEVIITSEIAEPTPGGAQSPVKICKIQIDDNGIGFSQEYADRIFEIFQRLHGRGEYAGTGIGLAIVRRIAERHGGNIRAEGRPGSGATFFIELPVNQVNEEDAGDV